MGLRASGIDWRGFLWALDYFSRSYFLGLMLITAWSAIIYVRVEGRRWRRLLRLDSGTTKMARNLESLVGFSSISARALIATQIVELCRFYLILRYTDADAVSALDEAWISTQLAVCILLVSAMRWRVCSILSDRVGVDHAASRK